ncbi:MAG: flagellar hook-basal body complex protein [Legionellaceae bacterium]|nr:flagellar hook-basal body complex protein [Legionellaceae bacterium]
MSMTYFNSLSGMVAASFGLKTVSNNVANIQSPGYKGSQVFYESLGGGSQHYESLGNQSGHGVALGNQKINFSQGALDHTGINTQLAINGDGLFILQLSNGEYRYTRDGEFSFNKAGYLIDDHSGAYVMGYGASRQLTRISTQGPASNPGKASTMIELSGVLQGKEQINPDQDSETGPSKKNYDDIEFSVEVFDEHGKSHMLHFLFGFTDEPDPSSNKLMLKKVTENDSIYFDAEFNMNRKSLCFDSSGYANKENCSIDLALHFAGCREQKVRFDFGNGKSEQALRLNMPPSPGQTEVSVQQQDGYPPGEQYQFSFNEKGQIIYHYTNGQSREGIQLALARFDDPNAALQSESNNCFRAKSTEGLHIGHAKDGHFGNIAAENIERSNIDSTTEFANIVILQRMFQACSQIMDIDKQLLEELYKKA